MKKIFILLAALSGAAVYAAEGQDKVKVFVFAARCDSAENGSSAMQWQIGNEYVVSVKDFGSSRAITRVETNDRGSLRTKMSLIDASGTQRIKVTSHFSSASSPENGGAAGSLNTVFATSGNAKIGVCEDPGDVGSFVLSISTTRVE